MNITIDQLTYVVVRNHILKSSKEVGLWEAAYFKGCQKSNVISGRRSVRLECISSVLTSADVRMSRVFLDVQKLMFSLESIGVNIVPADKSNPNMTDSVLYAIDYLAYLDKNMTMITA